MIPGMRIGSIRVLILTVGALLATTCGGEATPTAAPTVMPVPTATPTPLPTATPTHSALSLKEYMMRAFRAQTDINSLGTNHFQALSGAADAQTVRQLVIQFNRTMSQALDQALEALSDLTPPPEADAFHEALLTTLGDFRSFVDEQAAASATQDPSLLDAEGRRLLTETALVGSQGTELVIRALEAEGDDPLNAYVIAATKGQLRMASAVGAVLAKLGDAEREGDLNSILTVYGDLVAMFEQSEDQWAQLSPPPEAEDMHRRMVESITHQITANRQLLDVIRRQDEAALPRALQLLVETGAESTTVTADWNELLIKALSR